MLGSKLFLPGRKRPHLPTSLWVSLKAPAPELSDLSPSEGPTSSFCSREGAPSIPLPAEFCLGEGSVFLLFWLNRIRPSQRSSLPRASHSRPHTQRALVPPEGRWSLAEFRTPFARRLCSTEAPILQIWTPPLGLASVSVGIQNKSKMPTVEMKNWLGHKASAPAPCGASARLEQGLSAFPQHSSADGSKRGQGLLWQLPRPGDWQGPPRILCRVEQKPRKESPQTGWRPRQSLPSCGMPHALREGALLSVLPL